MINNNRIVPIQRTDYLSLIGTILNIAGVSNAVLASKDVEGTFVVPAGDDTTFLANQPVKSLDFGAGVTEATVYFVAGYDFEGITVNGTAATIDSSGVALADVKADGVTLYYANLYSGEVAITAVTPV